MVASQPGGGLRVTRPGTVPWQHMELGRGWPPFVTETSSLTVPLACVAAALVLTVRATLVFLDHGKGTCCLQRAASLKRPKPVCGCPHCSILWPTGESVGQKVPEGNSMRAGTRSHGPGSPGDARSLGGQGPGTHWPWPCRHAGLEHGCGSVGIVTGVWWGQGPCRSGHSGKVERSGHLLSCGHLGGLCVGLCPIAWRAMPPCGQFLGFPLTPEFPSCAGVQVARVASCGSGWVSGPVGASWPEWLWERETLPNVSGPELSKEAPWCARSPVLCCCVAGLRGQDLHTRYVRGGPQACTAEQPHTPLAQPPSTH